MATRLNALCLLALLVGCAILGAQQPILAPRLETFKRVESLELKAHVFEPPSSSAALRPAILLFHGGGWNGGDSTWVYTSARRFSALGMVAIAIDYRLSDEKTVTPLEAMADARDAFRWVRVQSAAFRIDPKRVAAYGVSAGGHLVAAAAMIGRVSGGPVDALERPDALVLYSPAIAISDSGWARRLLLGRASPETISPEAFVTGGLPPTYLSQGEADSLTPFAPAVRFMQHMRANGNVCEMTRYSGLGHLLSRKLDEQEWQYDPDPVARADAWRAEEAFLARQGFIGPQPAAPLSPEAVVRALTEALNAKDEKALASLVAPNLRWLTLLEDRTRVEAKGRKAFLRAVTASFQREPSLQRDLHMLATNGPWVSVRERAVWTGLQGKPYSRNAFVMYEVEGGMVVRAWIYPSRP